MGKFNEYLEKNHEKIFSILEIIISFKFGLIAIILPLILVLISLVSFIYFFRIDALIIFAARLSEVLPYSVGIYVGAFIIYLLLLAKFPNYKDDPFKKIGIAEFMGAIFLFAILASLLMSDYKPFSAVFYESFIKIISGLGTFIVAIVTVVTAQQSKKQLEEMKEQRKLQHDPELIAENEFKIYFHNCNESLKDFPELKKYGFEKEMGIWSKSSEKQYDYSKMVSNAIYNSDSEHGIKTKLKNLSPYSEKDVGLKIYNVGNGVAKQISYNWEFNFDMFFEISKHDSKKDPSIFKEAMGPNMTYHAGKQSVTIYNDESKDIKNAIGGGSYNLLLPHKSSEDPLVVPLPKSILKILGYFCKNQEHAFMNVPLYLHIKYRGIDNTLHVKKYKVWNYGSNVFKYSGSACNVNNCDYCELFCSVSEEETGITDFTDLVRE
ncbi:hypothetical protein HNP93_001335 [Methanococcus maripaludis]|uniref:Uncharacterized protein n=1 Tax=Methanococcus maripaludis TaxID=39152 RepID=A0A7J9P761_METMI|nr:hypothetical protein [Methanococcus maripaludis]MBA2858634.1 hypothetical protein [Methanococcus maripaludis]